MVTLLKEELKVSLFESTRRLFRHFVQVEQENEMKYQWSECLFNTIKIFDYFFEMHNS
jgi:hypothetical protein